MLGLSLLSSEGETIVHFSFRIPGVSRQFHSPLSAPLTRASVATFTAPGDLYLWAAVHV